MEFSRPSKPTDNAMVESFNGRLNQIKCIKAQGAAGEQPIEQIDYGNDANGNITTKQNTVDVTDSTTYTWDAGNRLIKIDQTGKEPLTASFIYDTFDRRVQSTITKGTQAPATVQYLYEGQQALGEIRDGKLSHTLLTSLSLDETITRIAINANGQKTALPAAFTLRMRSIA